MQQVGLVIKKHPDGFHYLPWDEDPHPDRPAIKAAILAHLHETGHTTAPMAGGHIKLVSGPHARLA